MPTGIVELRARLEQERDEIERVLAMHSGPGIEAEVNAAHSLFLAWQKINEAIAILSQPTHAPKVQYPLAKDLVRRASIAERIETILPSQMAGKTATQVPVPASPRLSTTQDDLTRIRGISTALARDLHQSGVEFFAQIARFTANDVQRLSAVLGLGRQISANNWIEQAALFATSAQSASGLEDMVAIKPPPQTPDPAAQKELADVVARAAARILASVSERVEQPLVEVAELLPPEPEPVPLASALQAIVATAVASSESEPPQDIVVPVSDSPATTNGTVMEETNGDPFGDDDDIEEAEIIIVASRVAQPAATAAASRRENERSGLRDQQAPADLAARLDQIELDSAALVASTNGPAPKSTAAVIWEDDKAEVRIVPQLGGVASPSARNGRIVNLAPGLAGHGHVFGREPIAAPNRRPSGSSNDFASVEIKLSGNVNPRRVAWSPHEPPKQIAPMSRFLRALKGK